MFRQDNAWQTRAAIITNYILFIPCALRRILGKHIRRVGRPAEQHNMHMRQQYTALKQPPVIIWATASAECTIDLFSFGVWTTVVDGEKPSQPASTR
jgi:hypothetical protein